MNTEGKVRLGARETNQTQRKKIRKSITDEHAYPTNHRVGRLEKPALYEGLTTDKNIGKRFVTKLLPRRKKRKNKF